MEISAECLLIFFIILIISYSLYISLYRYYYKIPVGIPFVRQNSGEKQLALRLAELYRNHRHPIVGIREIGIKPCLMVTDLDLINLVLVKHFNCFQNRGLFYNEISDPLSAVLGVVDHDTWKVMKRKVTPAFTVARLKQIFLQLKSACDELADNLIDKTTSGEQMIDIVDAFSRCTAKAIGAVAFGNHNDELCQMVVRAKVPYLTSRISEMMDTFPELSRSLGLRKHRREVSNFFVDLVSQIVQFRQENNIRMNDFVQSWIDADLEIHRIAAIAFDLMSTGFADSTSTLAYCLYELAHNKNIQDLAREEIKTILTNQDFTYDSLQQMTYCNQIIKEAERKYPVGGLAMRVATGDFKVPNTDIIIPDGMKIFIPIYAIHHDEKYYPDPEVFDPNRFSEESKRQRLKYSFLPFGAGPRQCIGYRFAEMVVGIGLVSLLRNFEFSTCSETRPIEFNRNKRTLHPKCGIILNVRQI